MITNDGRMTPVVVANAPNTPYVFIPTNVAILIANGPGVDSDTAIAESTPGVIAVNTATFAGYKVAGVWGSLVATIAIAAPAFIIISVISVFFAQFLALKWVGYAFSGIRVAVVVLIINAGIKLGKVNQKNIFNILLTIAAALLSALTSVNVIFILIGAMMIGIIYSLFSQKKKSAEETK